MSPRFQTENLFNLAKTIGLLILGGAIIALLYPDAKIRAAQSDTGHVTSVQVSSTVAPVLIASGNRGLVGMESYSVSTSTTWVKLYNAPSSASVTCGTGTPSARYLIVGNTNGAGYITANMPADIYTSGIVACFTTGFADSDTTAPAATTFAVNFHWQ